MSAVEDETLTPTEAAVVAGVPVRDVHRVIDEKIIPARFYRTGRDRARLFTADACALISFYFSAADQLTSQERLRTIATAASELRRESNGAREKGWIIRNQFLSIDLTPFLQSVRQRMVRLSSARALVVEDPDILGGTPVIRGTRIPVYDIAASVAAGISAERIQAAYSGLPAEQIELAALYAEARPPRGRPRRAVHLPPGAVLISSRKIPRRAETP